MKCDPIEKVIEAYRLGKQVIVVDDEDRENEGDLCFATEFATPEHLAFMMREARGLICITIDESVAERLSLSKQVDVNNSQFRTPFTISIDLASSERTGVSAQSRVECMHKMLDPESKPSDFVTPGHIFPLVANPAGVIGRRGQTEGSYDLARLAGLKPSGVICEILNPDGSMARGAQLEAFAKKHDLLVSSIEEIKRYRLRHEVQVREVANSTMETDWGPFDVRVFQDDVQQKEHLLLTYKADDCLKDTPLVRVHSECLTGDVFRSERCDCGGQLASAMKAISEYGYGMVVYLRQEGRGIGLINKLKAYTLQDDGRDTVEANIELGFQADQREYKAAANMLQSLGVSTIKLLTNNPQKIESLQGEGITVSERVSIITEVKGLAAAYMETKKEKLGHLL